MTFFLITFLIYSWQDCEESYLLFLKELDMLSHDVKQLINKSNILAVDLYLASHVYSTFWSHPYLLCVEFFKLWFSIVTKLDSLNAQTKEEVM